MVKMKVIIDTTVFTNFVSIGREEILKKVFGDFCFTTEEVIKELLLGEERGTLPKRDLGWLKVLKIESGEEHQSFMFLNQRLGKGESSCLSLAIGRNLNLLTDDLDARKHAQRRGVPVSGTIGVLVIAIKREIISLGEGNNLLSNMIQMGYYSPCKGLDKLV